MDLYFSPQCGNSKRVLFAIEELGIEVERRPLDLRRGDHKAAPYLALNPAGKVPLLVDRDLQLWESNAIMLYLAEQRPEHGLAPADTEQRASMFKWLFFLAYDVARPAFQLYFHLRGHERIGCSPDPRERDRARTSLEAALPVLAQQLASRSYLVDTFSLADLAYAPSMALLQSVEFDFGPWPDLADWVSRILDRPAWQRCTAA